MKFMEKHIQRRRTFSNVSCQFAAKPRNNTLDKLKPSLQIESTPFQSNQIMAQSIQEWKKIQSTCTENNQMERYNSRKCFLKINWKKVHTDLQETVKILNLE
ncbi:uncharacterized protein [Mycetomoellerius zeteki]|uniref:uncharacterized protein n=1 Tax=Mycetomoellerius zeteki TaxID=64791 RepID=UPI00084E4FEA|nr:PREDICTED: uncharacterized protein LOC108730374 [Trachymyrmex zeteki]